MPSLELIRSRIAAHRPEQVEAPRRAAVAMVLCERDPGPEVLFIERARHEADPWSGHMAFPGGRVEPEDDSDRSAAERETLEEVGVSLEGAAYLGRLDDLQGRQAGRPAGLVISGHVYHVVSPEPLRPNFEVAEAFWFPVRDLRDPDRHVEYRPEQLPESRFQGILVGQPDRHVVWGLTYRFLEDFFRILELPLRSPA